MAVIKIINIIKKINLFPLLDSETDIHSRNKAKESIDMKIFKIRFDEYKIKVITIAEIKIAVIERFKNSCLSSLTESSLRIKIFVYVSFKILF